MRTRSSSRLYRGRYSATWSLLPLEFRLSGPPSGFVSPRVFLTHGIGFLPRAVSREGAPRGPGVRDDVPPLILTPPVPNENAIAFRRSCLHEVMPFSRSADTPKQTRNAEDSPRDGRGTSEGPSRRRRLPIPHRAVRCSRHNGPDLCGPNRHAPSDNGGTLHCVPNEAC